MIRAQFKDPSKTPSDYKPFEEEEFLKEIPRRELGTGGLVDMTLAMNTLVAIALAAFGLVAIGILLEVPIPFWLTAVLAAMVAIAAGLVSRELQRGFVIRKYRDRK